MIVALVSETTMATVQLVTSLVGSLGFPIVACVALFWKINEQDKQHKDETETLAKTIQANTEAITRLTAHLEGKGN